MFRRIDPAPLTLSTFLHPLTLVAYPAVTLPAVAYSMVFLWGGVMITFEIPQIFPEQFGFNAQQVGLQYIGVIIGTILGEQVGGISSDKWMLARQRRLQDSSHVAPEYRLWLSYAGYALTICGVAVFLVQIDRAGETWNVTPIVGAAIAAAGNQIVTTVLITYAVDCHSDQAASIGVYVTLVRQCWGFIGPFWWVLLPPFFFVFFRFLALIAGVEFADILVGSLNCSRVPDSGSASSSSPS